MPADGSHDDASSSRDVDYALAADAGTDEASASPPTSLPSQSRYGTADSTALTGDFGRVHNPGADAAYAPIPFLGVGDETYDNNQATRNSNALEGQLTGSPISVNNLDDQNPFIPSFVSEWDPSFGSFLDLVHAYEPQGEIAHEQTSTAQDFNIPQSLPVQSTITPTIATSTPAEAPRPTQSTTLPQPSTGGPPALRTALKRKAEPEPNSAEPDRTKVKSSDWQAGRNRTVSFGRMSKPSASPSAEGVVGAENLGEDRTAQRSTDRNQKSKPSSDNGGSTRPTVTTPSASNQGNHGAGKPPGILRGSKVQLPPSILPAEKVFPIQIGSELFRLSGASITSDAPSYFSQFFEEQLRQNEDGGGVRTLYIDRDPVTFQDISRHLQGYHVRPHDGSHFVKLFADAQFYSLPRLISQLFESEIFIQIGDRHFQIPRDIFSGPGDSPNFFSLGFAVFFSTPGEVFPGLDRKGLLRPPSILPPSVPNRSADVFAQLLHMLRGYPLHVANEDHRAELLRDCRYFHLRGLEQKLIAHHISYNLERQKTEIVLRLEDIRQSGVSFISDVSTSDRSPSGGWVNYARPFIDDTSYELILEIGAECTILDLNAMRADFHGLAKARVSSLFQVVANKMNLPTNAPLGLMMMSGGASAHTASPGHTPLSEDRVKIRIERDADITLDGQPYEVDWSGFRGAGVTASSSQGEHNDSDAATSSDVMSTHMSRTSSGAGLAAGRGSISDASLTQQLQPHFPPSRLQTTRGPAAAPPSAKKRKRRGSLDAFGEWIVRKGQWRLRIQANPMDAVRGGMEIVFVAVKLDAVSGERGRNGRRSFLT